VLHFTTTSYTLKKIERSKGKKSKNTTASAKSGIEGGEGERDFYFFLFLGSRMAKVAALSSMILFDYIQLSVTQSLQNCKEQNFVLLLHSHPEVHFSNNFFFFLCIFFYSSYFLFCEIDEKKNRK